MTEHSHGEGGACPACKKVQAHEKKLDAVLERSESGSTGQGIFAHPIAIAELLDDHGLAGGKREFMLLVKRRFRELDAAGCEETLH